MKVLVLSSYSHSLVNFRGDLIKEMADAGHKVAAAGPEEGYEGKISGLGARFVRIALDRTGTSIIHDSLYFRNLFKVIREETPDVLFCYTMKPVIYGSLAGKLAGVEKIYPMVTGLGYVFTSCTLKSKILKLTSGYLYKTALFCASRVFFQNRDDLNELVKLNYVKKEKCVLVNGSGVNMERFQRKPLPEKTSFLMISRLLKSKGVMEYLEAAKAVKEKYPEIEFALAGPVENSPDAVNQQELRHYTENGIVRYHGRREDVRPFLEKCSVYVLPSYREGTPRTVLEAMATGRPVITTDAPGCRETVKDGVNGFLVPPKNSGALAERMIWMVENPGSFRAMADESHRICTERFDVKKVNSVILGETGLRTTNAGALYE